jgi:hypothetical protein
LTICYVPWLCIYLFGLFYSIKHRLKEFDSYVAHYLKMVVLKQLKSYRLRN